MNITKHCDVAEDTNTTFGKKATTDRANGEWSVRITGIMDEAKTALEAARGAASEAQELVARNGPRLDDILANATLASQQLKLATIEIRASPWRLLY